MTALRPFGSACEVDEPGSLSPGPGFHWMLLRRHGRRPLAVMGRGLLRADNRCAGLRWFSDIAIYETASGRFAVCLRHVIPGTADPVWCDAWLCDGADAVRHAFGGHDPLTAWPPWSAGIAWTDEPEAGRFRGAWAGLLAAVFGRTADDGPA
ncbi:MAG TPA: hypothetical protein PLD10_03630 [Rhodopila sp.]|nr:hypothetical protein [Rhodopila sp.]